MSWCCGRSKEKKVPNSTLKVDKPLQKPSIISPRIPKSTITFSASDYDAKPFNNQTLFGQTQRVQAVAQGNLDRDSRYHEQAVNSKESKLLVSKELLNYDLDKVGGVSGTPVINTFHYQSMLSHFFVDTDPNKYNQSQRKSSRLGESGVYDYGSQPNQFNRDTFRNTKKSEIYSSVGEKIY